jgi:hypothetical protein
VAPSGCPAERSKSRSASIQQTTSSTTRSAENPDVSMIRTRQRGSCSSPGTRSSHSEPRARIHLIRVRSSQSRRQAASPSSSGVGGAARISPNGVWPASSRSMPHSWRSSARRSQVSFVCCARPCPHRAGLGFRQSRGRPSPLPSSLLRGEQASSRRHSNRTAGTTSARLSAARSYRPCASGCRGS